MKRLILILIVLVLATFSATFAFAQDDVTPPDPADNLCYEGGAWDDGRCDIPGHVGATDLAWTCGWYMVRLYRGEISAADVIADCQHLLVAATDVICKTFDDEGGYTICLRADQTGDLTCEGEDFPCIAFRFIDNFPESEGDCPLVDGYFPVLPIVTYEEFEGEFTDDELAALGLKPYGCLYYFD